MLILIFYLIVVLLWSSSIPLWILHLTRHTVNPNTWLDCKLFYFAVIFSGQWSSCLLAVMCIEKFFALYFPFKARSICTVTMAKRVIFIVTLILVAIDMQLFFIFETRALPKGVKYCSLVRVPLSYLKIYIKLDYTLNSYFPFTIMVLTNGAIIYKFMRASCARAQGGIESTNQALSKVANRGTAMLIHSVHHIYNSDWSTGCCR